MAVPETGTEELERATLRKVTRRHIPFLFLLYIVACLDRVNVGFAALQMNADLRFSAATFGFGSGIFFLGYCLCEVPSNLVLDQSFATTRGVCDPSCCLTIWICAACALRAAVRASIAFCRPLRLESSFPTRPGVPNTVRHSRSPDGARST